MWKGEAGQRSEGADDDVAAFRLDSRQDFGRLKVLLLEQALEFMRHHDAQPGEQRDDVDGKGDEERIAPAPVKEVRARQGKQEEGEQPARHQQGQRRAELGHHRVPAALMLRRVQRQQRSQTIPGAAKRNALCGSQDDQHQRSIMANGRITGHEGDGCGRTAQQEQRDGQLRSTAVATIDRHEDQRTDRPRDEGDGKDREGIEGAGQGIHIGEHQARKHDDRGDGVNEEIEKFGGATNDHTNGNITRRDLVVPRIDQARIILQRSGGEGHGL